jgi:hypothetical protein
LTPWLLFGRDEDVPWRRVGGAGVHLDIGWTKMRTRTERPGLPRSLGRGRPGGARSTHSRACPSARRRRPRAPRETFDGDPASKHLVAGPLLRQTRPLICPVSPHATASPKTFRTPTRSAPPGRPAAPVIFHENPQVCNILPSPDQGGVRHHRHP